MGEGSSNGGSIPGQKIPGHSPANPQPGPGTAATLGDPKAGGASPLPRVKYPGTELCVWRSGFQLERFMHCPSFPFPCFQPYLRGRNYRNFSHMSPRVETITVAASLDGSGKAEKVSPPPVLAFVRHGLEAVMSVQGPFAQTLQPFSPSQTCLVLHAVCVGLPPGPQARLNVAHGVRRRTRRY